MTVIGTVKFASLYPFKVQTGTEDSRGRAGMLVCRAISESRKLTSAPESIRVEVEETGHQNKALSESVWAGVRRKRCPQSSTAHMSSATLPKIISVNHLLSVTGNMLLFLLHEAPGYFISTLPSQSVSLDT